MGNSDRDHKIKVDCFYYSFNISSSDLIPFQRSLRYENQFDREALLKKETTKANLKKSKTKACGLDKQLSDTDTCTDDSSSSFNDTSKTSRSVCINIHYFLNSTSHTLRCRYAACFNFIKTTFN